MYRVDCNVATHVLVMIAVFDLTLLSWYRYLIVIANDRHELMAAGDSSHHIYIQVDDRHMPLPQLRPVALAHIQLAGHAAFPAPRDLRHVPVPSRAWIRCMMLATRSKVYKWSAHSVGSSTVQHAKTMPRHLLKAVPPTRRCTGTCMQAPFCHPIPSPSIH